MLRVGIPLAILGKLLLQGLFELCIPCAERLVGSQDVPEPQVVAPLGVVAGDDVQMMRPDVRCRIFHEEVTPITATIAAIQVAEGTKRLPTLGNYRHGGYGYGYIQNRFRVETGHCSTPHMLDIQHEVPNVLMKGTPFLLEQVVPVLMVCDNLYSTSFQADHVSSLNLRSNTGGEPRPEAEAKRRL